MRKRSTFVLFLGSFALAVACGNDSGGDGGSPLSGGSAGSPASNEAAGTEAGAGGARLGGAGDSPGGEPAVQACTNNADCDALLGEATPAGCAVAKCSVTSGECVFTTTDADGDGYRAAECETEQVELETGDDCDDENPQVFPGAWDGPAVEGEGDDRCDQKDNDCNGEPDDGEAEGATCVCDPAKDIDVPCDELADGTPIVWPSGTVKGACKQGQKSCINGAWGECKGAVLPLDADLCTPGDDSSCNGLSNEACPCITGETRNCGIDVGSCKHGTQSCVAGTWSTACVGEIAPKDKDTCAPGNDDSCNGTKNEGCTCINGASATCAAVYGSKGVCAAGNVTCVGGEWPASCPVTGGKELCNKDQVDEDCNSDPDNGCTCYNGDISSSSCGTCGNGYRVCTNGSYDGVACNGASGPWTYYQDGDGDGYCNRGAATSQCSKPGGYLEASCPSDCRDNNGYIPGQNSHCSDFWLGSTSSHSCATFGGGCGVSNEWQISWDEAPGACPAGFHPKCSARWVSGNAGTQCWLAGESYDGNLWSCRLHPSSAGFDGVTCAMDIDCIPDP